ncbi:MAG: OmpA family protein [Gammaproteobacteria bacterium]|nr:OmpA family protein [Gammaproteobacteria bacterium]
MSARFWKPLLVASLLLPLAACQTVGTQDDEGIAVEDRAAGSSVSTSGLDEAGGRVRGIGGVGGVGGVAGASGLAGSWRGKSVDDPTSPLSKRVIYFDYDSDEVREEYRSTLEAHSAYLAEKRAAATLEGNTDERGSREYNLGLGERRAQAVRRLMTAYGAGGNQLRAVSFGEEKPAADGGDESAWSLNRRVEIVYGSR